MNATPTAIAKPGDLQPGPGLTLPKHDRLPVIAYGLPTYTVRIVGQSRPAATGLGYADARSMAASRVDGLLGGRFVVDLIDETSGAVVEIFR